MARGHLFFIVVLLSAAAVAGLLAVTRTAAQSAPAASTDPAITFRLKKLDKLEASLERQAARRQPTAQTAPTVVYRRAASPAASAPRSNEEAEALGSEYEGERDD